MIQKYLNGAIFYDILVGIILGFTFYLLIQKFSLNIDFPKDQSGLVSSILVVSSMLLGFLMTIITVIITFKKGFEIKIENDCENYKKLNNPESTVFDKKPKQHHFYGTPMVEFVTTNFIKSAIEISIVVIFLLIREFFNPNIPEIISASITLCIIVMLSLTIIRSLHVFKLYMMVHSKDLE
jgi:hypothetical protein